VSTASRLSPDELRAQAERRSASNLSDLASLTPAEVLSLVHELEVHKSELELQNEELHAAQEEAETSRQRYLHLYDSSPTGYLTLDSEGRIVEANLSISAMLAIPRPQLIGIQLSAFLTPHCQDRWHLAQRDLLKGRTRMDFTLEFRSAEGGLIDAQIVGTSASLWSFEPTQIQLVVIDVTELRKKERALQAAVTAATLAEERERRKLAADLHDDVGQLLALASLKLHEWNEDMPTEIRARTIELEELLEVIRRRTSSLSFQLSPPLLHDVGLVSAVEWLAEDLMTTHGLSVQVIEEQVLNIDENTRVTFYRAIRELLLNVVKHAGVKKARVRITADEGMTRIAIEDDGVGMPPTAKRYGFGLVAVRDRVEQLGGSLEVTALARAGSKVVVSLPTDRPRRGAEGVER